MRLLQQLAHDGRHAVPSQRGHALQSRVRLRLESDRDAWIDCRHRPSCAVHRIAVGASPQCLRCTCLDGAARQFHMRKALPRSVGQGRADGVV
ncbi:hypothetical protein RINTHH_18540 [Richelia intracellularis HH01]|uniref:Uncharacterized protein n=1 Tax=Richelia intracellularis HH01 TaxID=1165094 RepID=M1WTC6_9NOST|nr:hypothetical protein RINTHH_18540 [Richelia intracellularis HH01]